MPVVDVVTEGGKDYVAFHRHPRVQVEEVRALVRADESRR